MELMLIVYVVGFLASLSDMVGVVLMVLLIATFSMWFVVLGPMEMDDKAVLTAKKYSFWKTGILLAVLSLLIPSTDTIKYMAGAYLLQEVATSDTAKEIGSLSVDAVKSQLKLWAKDNEELTLLIDAANVPVEDK